MSRGWPTTSSTTLKASQNHTFRATARDGDGNLSSCQWYIDNARQDSHECDKNFGGNTGSKTATILFNYGLPGTYTVRVVFTDSGGETDEVSWRVTVNSAPEVTLVSPTDRSLSIYGGQELDFSVTAEDDDGNLAKWKVDKVGAVVTTNIEPERTVANVQQFTPTFSHLFDLSPLTSQGTWEIKPTFTDSLGESGSDFWKVTVRRGPDLHLESIDGPVRSVYNDQDINFGVALENKGGTATNWYNVSARVSNIASGKETVFEHAGSNPEILERGIESPIAAGQSFATTFASPNLDGIESGDYRLCAIAQQVGADAYDSNENDNEVCKDLYILPSSTGAMEVHLGLTLTDSGRRVWSAVPADLGSDAVRSGADASDLENDKTLKELYQRLAGELAFRKALEPELENAYVLLDGFTERVGTGVVGTGITIGSAQLIFKMCTDAGVPCDDAIRDTGLLESGLLDKLPDGAFDFAADSIEGTLLFGDAYFTMLVNQALNRKQAFDTLDQLALLPLGPVWREAVDESRRDVATLSSPDKWIAFAATVEDNKEEFITFAALAGVKSATAAAIKHHLLQKSIIFSQKALAHALGIKLAGGAALSGAAGTTVAAGSTALFVASVWFASEVYSDVEESHDRLGVGSLASFINAAFYDPSHTGDLREALAYAKYAAYDNFHKSDDTWIQALSWRNLLRPGSREEFLEEMADERDKALEDLRELVALSSIEMIPVSLALTVGNTGKLEVTALTGSGKSASTQGFEWSSSATEVATVSSDGTVTAIAPGTATITVTSEGISTTADVVVTKDPIADTCSNGVAVSDPGNSPELVSDCEALLQMRDSLVGTKTLDWSTSRSISSWLGLSFHADVRRVAGIKLDELGLDGTLPSTISGPTQIMFINLSGNELTGSIPAALGTLGQLRILDLSENQLSGSIPANLTFAKWSNLEELKINDNRLTGTIPAGIRYLTALRILDLSNNGLRGAIPRNLSELESLLTLNLRDNSLTSPIPGQLGELPVLAVLDLRDNDLTGRLPENLDNLGSHLRELYLSGNSELSGCITDRLWQVPVNDYATAELEQCSNLPVPVAVTWASGILNLSRTTLDSTSGDVIASVVTVDGDQQASAPTFTITGLVVGGVASKAGTPCTAGRVAVLNNGERCWEASFTLPANTEAAERPHNVTVRSGQIPSVPVGRVTVAAAETTTTEETTTEEPGPTSTVTAAVVAALAPLGGNLKWVLHFDNETQGWLYYNQGAPPEGTLDQLAPGRVYWLGLEEDQTVVLGGVTRVLKAGLNQVVW